MTTRVAAARLTVLEYPVCDTWNLVRLLMEDDEDGSAEIERRRLQSRRSLRIPGIWSSYARIAEVGLETVMQMAREMHASATTMPSS